MLQIHTITIRNGDQKEFHAKEEDEVLLTLSARYQNVYYPNTGELIPQATISYVLLKKVKDIVDFKYTKDSKVFVDKAHLYKN